MAFSWYALKTVSGTEKKVSKLVAELVEKQGLKEYFQDILVFEEDVVKIKKGRKSIEKKVSMPGYVMLHMEINEKTKHLLPELANIDKVKSFLGKVGYPQRIPDSQIKNMLKQIEEKSEQGIVSESFEVGDNVTIVDGPFDSFIGTIEEVDYAQNRLKVLVSIFGRSTPLELEYSQVTKNE